MRISPAATQRVAVGVMWALAAITLSVLVFILGYILAHGLPHVTWSFLTESPESMGRKGGILPMIVGKIMIPSTIEAASTERPGPPREWRMSGTSVTTPTNP